MLPGVVIEPLDLARPRPARDALLVEEPVVISLPDIVPPVPFIPLPFMPLLSVPLPAIPLPVIPPPFIVPGIDPLPPAEPGDIEPLVPAPAPPPPAGAVWASAVVARTAKLSAMIVFIGLLLVSCPQRGGGFVVGVVLEMPDVVGSPGCPLTAGTFAIPGASVPTRPSPIVPVDPAPIGGVTPVDGCGSAGIAADPGVGARPSPDGVVPGSGSEPAGAYGITLPVVCPIAGPASAMTMQKCRITRLSFALCR